MKFSLSTSWNRESAKDMISMLKEIRDIGFNKIELNFTLTSKDISDIASVKDGLGIEVTSLHNFCPIPVESSITDASPDYYPLSSLDEGLRGKAVNATKKTIETAKRLSARAVILHLGRVEIRDKTRKLGGNLDHASRHAKIKSKMLEERREKSAGHFEQALKSLNELSGFAKKAGITLGIENRFYYREIPSPDEMQIILDTFKDDHIGYWHDVGHAQISENVGLYNHKKDYLDRFSHRMVGMHLHDSKDIDDHRAPAQGNFDFSILKPYIKKDTLLVLEPQFPASPREIKDGVKQLTKILGDAQ